MRRFIALVFVFGAFVHGLDTPEQQTSDVTDAEFLLQHESELAVALIRHLMDQGNPSADALLEQYRKIVPDGDLRLPGEVDLDTPLQGAERLSGRQAELANASARRMRQRGNERIMAEQLEKARFRANFLRNKEKERITKAAEAERKQRDQEASHKAHIAAVQRQEEYRRTLAREGVFQTDTYDLVAMYVENELAAERKTKGKVVEVSGMLEQVQKGVDGTYFAILTPQTPYTYVRVQCFFPDENLDALADLDSGDFVTIRGTCLGMRVNVLLEGCRVR